MGRHQAALLRDGEGEHWTGSEMLSFDVHPYDTFHPYLLVTIPELLDRSIWMLTLFSVLFWITNVTLESDTSLYTSTLLAPFTLVGAGSACMAHLDGKQE